MHFACRVIPRVTKVSEYHVYSYHEDQGHVVEVVVIANPSPYTLLTVSLLLALSTMHLNTNPYKTVLFFLYGHIQCVEDLASPHT